MPLPTRPRLRENKISAPNSVPDDSPIDIGRDTAATFSLSLDSSMNSHDAAMRPRAGNGAVQSRCWGPVRFDVIRASDSDSSKRVEAE